MKNYITLCLLAVFCAFSISSLSAQDKKETKKVVIVEKTVDADGNVTETRVVKEGKDAEDYINKMDSEGENIRMKEKTVEIEIEDTDYEMTEKEQYKMVIKSDDGHVKVMEWDGEGEMPEEMKELLKKNNVHVDDDHKSKVIIKKNEGGSEDVIELKLENGEISDDVKKIFHEQGIDLKLIENENGDVRIIYETKHDEKNNNKAQLGVFIEENINGAKITEFTEVSAAKDAGLVHGDIITHVNKNRVNNIEGLVESLSSFEAGDIITLDYLRGDVVESKEITLKKRENHFQHKTWEEVMEDEDGHKKRVVKKKVIIKEEK